MTAGPTVALAAEAAADAEVVRRPTAGTRNATNSNIPTSIRVRTVVQYVRFSRRPGAGREAAPVTGTGAACGAVSAVGTAGTTCTDGSAARHLVDDLLEPLLARVDDAAAALVGRLVGDDR